MNVNEFIKLPIVKDAIQQKLEQETRAAAEARAAILTEIEEAESLLQSLIEPMAMLKADAERMRLEYQEALSAATNIYGEVIGVQHHLQSLHTRLIKEHGEHFVRDAIKKLNGYRLYLLRERDRLGGIASRVVEPIRGYRRMLENPKAKADLKEVNRQMILVDDALDRAKQLENARLSPLALQQMTDEILMSVLPSE